MLDGEHISYQDFIDAGFTGPIRLLKKPRANFFAKHASLSPYRPAVWEKDLGTIDPLVYGLASDPKLVDMLRQLLGDDIILWGGSFVVRKPRHVHPWHCDIESCALEGGFATVWIGLANTRKDSGLKLIPGSHVYGATVQELSARESVSRDERTDDTVLRLANSQESGAQIVQPEIDDGEAIIFDGRMWHGSKNLLTDAVRVSLILQYARADKKLKIPDYSNLEWPFHFTDARPPVIAVAGQGDPDVNALVPAPVMALAKELQPSCHPIDKNLRCDEGDSFKPVPCFLGRTANAEYLECHYSVLMPGASPHRPHRHLEEEILIVMNGAGELVLPDAGTGDTPKIIPAKAGSAVYYPPYFPHTIQNKSDKPVTYAMMKWKSARLNAGRRLGPQFMPPSWLEDERPRSPKSMKLILEDRSAFLAKLHMHITRIEPDAGYGAHRDVHDVAIFLIQGEIQVLDSKIPAPAVVFLPGGCLHDMRSTGAETAKYVVWEFHIDASENAGH